MSLETKEQLYYKPVYFLSQAKEALIRQGNAPEAITEQMMTDTAANLMNAAYTAPDDPDEIAWLNGVLDGVGAKKLSDQEKADRAALHEKAVKSMVEADLHGQYKVQNSGYHIPEGSERGVGAFLFPGHEGEFEQFAVDYKAARTGEQKAELQIKATGWMLENEKELKDVLGKDLTDAELVENWPKIEQYTRAAGEIVNFYNSQDPLVSTGTMKESEFLQNKARANRLYALHTECQLRMNTLANALYPEYDIEAIGRADQASAEAAATELRDDSDEATPATMLASDVSMSYFVYANKVSEQLAAQGYREPGTTLFCDVNGNEIKGLPEVLYRLKHGEPLVAVDPGQPDKPAIPVSDPTGKKPVCSDKELRLGLGAAKKPSGWDRFLNWISPKLHERLRGSEKVQEMRAWKNAGRLSEMFDNETVEDRMAELARTYAEKYPKSAENFQKEKAEQAAKRREYLAVRTAKLKEKDEQMRAEARLGKGILMDQMKRDCVLQIGKEMHNLEFGTANNREDVLPGAVKAGHEIAGRAMFLSHLEDAMNGPQEVKDALGKLTQENVDKLYEDYKNSPEYKTVVYEASKVPLASRVEMGSVAALKQGGGMMSFEVGEKQFDALKDYQTALKKETAYYAKKTAPSDYKPYDLQGKVMEALDKMQAPGQEPANQKNAEEAKNEMQANFS